MNSRINAPINVKPDGEEGFGHGVGILALFGEKNVNFPTPGTTYLVKSIKIPHPQASKGRLHTLKSFKFLHSGDIMYNKTSTQETGLIIKFLWAV